MYVPLYAVSLRELFEVSSLQVWVSHLVVGVWDVGAVSPLGQDDGLHRFSVQTATLCNISGLLRRGVVVLEGGNREMGLHQYTKAN